MKIENVFSNQTPPKDSLSWCILKLAMMSLRTSQNKMPGIIDNVDTF